MPLRDMLKLDHITVIDPTLAEFLSAAIKAGKASADDVARGAEKSVAEVKKAADKAVAEAKKAADD